MARFHYGELSDDDPICDAFLRLQSRAPEGELPASIHLQDYKARFCRGRCSPAQCMIHRGLGKVIPSPAEGGMAQSRYPRIESAIERASSRDPWFLWRPVPIGDLLRDWSIQNSWVLASENSELNGSDNYLRKKGSDADPLLRIGITLHVSAAIALSCLRGLLPLFSIEPIEYNLGDCAFGLPDKQAIAFVRGNALIQVTNAGPATESILSYADGIDRLLTARESAGIGMREEQGSPSPIELPIDLPPDAGEGPVWYRLLPDNGTIYADRGRLYYAAKTTGEQLVTVYRHRGAAVDVRPVSFPVE